MGAREAFGPNLKRIRLQRGISLDRIALDTKVDVKMLESLERNDFEGWPSGIFARAHVRAYALAIDIDPEATVDEFCRWFPQGDRRAARVIKGQAEIVGHALEWKDEVPPSVKEERRASNRATATPKAPERWPGRLLNFGQMFGRLRRTFGRV